MQYSRKALIGGLRVLGAKRIWNLDPQGIAKARHRMQRFGLLHRGRPGPGVQVRQEQHQGQSYYVISPVDRPARRQIFYAHGGGYVYETTRFHWDFLYDLCRETESQIIVPSYPLAPEHGKAEVVPWLISLLTSQVGAGDAAGAEIVLMGDSAGGGLSLALAMQARDHRLFAVAATILISPWLDILAVTPEMLAVDSRDPMLDAKGLARCASYYLADAEDDLLSSPIAGDFAGLENLVVFTGTRDCLWPQAKALRNRCREQGVPVDYHESSGSLHVFPLFSTPDGLRARAEIYRILGRG